MIASWMRILLILLSLWGKTALSAQPQPLPVDQAFALVSMAKDPQTILLKWTIAPHYYLYRERIHIQSLDSQKNKLSTPMLPDGIAKHSEWLGDYQIYMDDITLVVPVLKAQKDPIDFSVEYQGCSSEGYCYPPVHKIFTLNLQSGWMLPVLGYEMELPAANKAAAKTLIPHQFKTPASEWFATSWYWTLLIFFGLGILLTFTPCVLPMLPILSSIIVGQKETGGARSLWLASIYVFGMACTYALIGIVFGYLGSNLQAYMQTPWVIVLFSGLFIAMALSLFGLFELQLPAAIRSRLHALNQSHSPGTFIGVFLMGVLSTLVVSPCVTPPLVGVLGYISQTGNIGFGGLALFFMGLGMGAPLVLITLGGLRYLPKRGAWMNKIKIILGILLLGVAISMLMRLRSEHTASHQADALGFVHVESLTDLQQHLQAAKARHQPVLLDYYASWCISCKSIDRWVFADPKVQAKLKKFVLLRADVTDNTADSKALLSAYGVFAPPTILFFNTDGTENRQQRLVGELDQAAFLAHLLALTAAPSTGAPARTQIRY